MAVYEGETDGLRNGAPRQASQSSAHSGRPGDWGRASLRDVHHRALPGHLADDPGAGIDSPWNRRRAQDASADEGHHVAGLDRARSMALGRSVMKRIHIGRRRVRSERPSLEVLALDPRDSDIVRAKALARTARSREAPGK